MDSCIVIRSLPDNCILLYRVMIGLDSLVLESILSVCLPTAISITVPSVVRNSRNPQNHELLAIVILQAGDVSLRGGRRGGHHLLRCSWLLLPSRDKFLNSTVGYFCNPCS